MADISPITPNTPNFPSSSSQADRQRALLTPAKSEQPFRVVHQRLVMTVDLYERTLVGFTDLHCVSNVDMLQELNFHCGEQCKVTNACIIPSGDGRERVATNEAEDGEQNSDSHRVDDGKTNGDTIDEKDATSQRANQSVAGPDVRFMEFDHQWSDGEHYKWSLVPLMRERWNYQKAEDAGFLMVRPTLPIQKDEKLVVRLYFNVHNPSTVVYFVNDNAGTQMPYMYTHSRGNCARHWFPCIDNVTNLSTFEFEITTHRDAVVICTGDLVRQVEDELSIMKTSYFIQRRYSILAQSIALAIGPFEVLPDPQLPLVTHFYPPHVSRESMLHTVEFMKRLFKFFENYSGIKFHRAFGTYKQVFLDNSRCDTASYSTMALLSTDLILDSTIIDNTLETRLKISKLFCMQAFSHFMLPRTWADLWLTVGCGGFVALQFLQEEFGKNELRYYLMKTAREISDLETYTQPLFCETFISPIELYTPLLFAKSPLVIYMIAQKGANMKQALRRFFSLPSALTEQNELERFMITRDFLRNIRKTYSLIDLTMFARYWIYDTGVPHLQCGFSFDATRNVIEFVVKQVLPYPNAKIFSGYLTVRVHELEGTFNYVMPVTDVFNHTEFPCHTKARKKQRKRMIEEGRQEEQRIQIPIMWIRVDPDMEWVRVLSFKQTETMWVNQLEKDRDVVAQIEAADALPSFSKSIHSLSKLDTLLYDKSLYYRVHIEIIHAMTKFTDPGAKIAALEYLLRFYKSNFFDDKQQYLRPNDFSDFAKYYIKKEMPLALAHLRDDENSTPQEIADFLLYLLKYNDNSENEYSDAFYVASLLQALSEMKTDTQRTAKAVGDIKKHLVLDKLMPSYHGVVTVSCLKSYADMQIEEKCELDLGHFWEYLDAENGKEVRLAALECLIRLSGAKSHGISFQAILDRILQIVEREKICYLQKRAMLELLATYHTKHVQNLVELAYQARTSPDHTAKRSISQLDLFVLHCRAQTAHLGHLVKRLWKQMAENWNRQRLLGSLVFLYQSLFGQGTPTCMTDVSTSSFNAAKLGSFIELEVEHTEVIIDEVQMTATVNYARPLTPPPPHTPLTITISRSVASTQPRTQQALSPPPTLAPPAAASPPSSPEVAPPPPPPPSPPPPMTISPPSAAGRKIIIKQPTRETPTLPSQQQPTPTEVVHPSQTQQIPSQAPPPPISSEKQSAIGKKRRKKAVTKDGEEKVKKKKKKDMTRIVIPLPEQTHAADQGPSSAVSTTSSTKLKLKFTRAPPVSQPPPVPRPPPLQRQPVEIAATPQVVTIDVSQEDSLLKSEAARHRQQDMERSSQGEVERNIAIIIEGLPRPIYARLYYTETAATIFRSLPIHSYPLQLMEGLAWFTVNVLEQISQEPDSRIVVNRGGELAYWVNSSCIVIAYGRTVFTKNTGTRNIRLSEACNIFASLLYSVKLPSDTPTNTRITVQRLRRVAITILPKNETSRTLELELDLYDTDAANAVHAALQNTIPISYPNLFHGKFYFALLNTPLQNPPIPVKKGRNEFYSKTMSYGEVALWRTDMPPGFSIVVGSGKTKNDVPLTTECFIIGRVVRNLERVLQTIQADFDEDTSVRFHLRRVSFSIVHNGTQDTLCTFIATLRDNLPADNIYECLPFDERLPITYSHDNILRISVASLINSKQSKYRILDQGDASDTQSTVVECGFGDIAYSAREQTVLIRTLPAESAVSNPRHVWATTDVASIAKLRSVVAANPAELVVVLRKFSGNGLYQKPMMPTS